MGTKGEGRPLAAGGAAEAGRQATPLPPQMGWCPVGGPGHPPAACFSSAEGCCAAGPCPAQSSPPAPGGPRLCPGRRCSAASPSSAAAPSAAPSSASSRPAPPTADEASGNPRGRPGQVLTGRLSCCPCPPPPHRTCAFRTGSGGDVRTRWGGPAFQGHRNPLSPPQLPSNHQNLGKKSTSSPAIPTAMVQ